MQKQMITLADGRKLEVHTSGSPGPKAIVFHHGTPGSALSWQSWLHIAAAQGVFAIAYSRPGYGASARRKGRTVISNSTDISEVLNHFGVTKTVSDWLWLSSGALSEPSSRLTKVRFLRTST